jgi:hypothetical protein
LNEKQIEAESLRKQGLTYKQIVSALDGAVSIDWCKRNLKGSAGVTRERINPECVDEIIKLGERPQGIMHYEANAVILTYYPQANDYKQRYIREKAKSQSNNCIIHYGWIDYMKPNESHKAINAFALHLMDQVDSMVDDYMFSYPNANKWSVRYEMLKLAFDKAISQESLRSRVYTNELLAERMETRYQ